jgi:NAD(P)-dependent dehydrogenase (short-subunit alcohol dehydrogenase family)
MSEQVAVLSGGAGGIASACARRLLADGARVALDMARLPGGEP